MAQEILKKAMDQTQPDDLSSVADMFLQFQDRLDITLGTELRGRTAADTAFNLALAGIQDEKLFDKLYCISRLEMQRVGSRSSQRSKDLLHIVEKLAASGADPNNPDVKWIYQFVARRLEEREECFDITKLLAGYNLLQPRPLLWIWRFSSSLAKVDPNITTGCNFPTFKDNTKPLVVDVGCGFGVSLLGLASLSDDNIESDLNVDWGDCNYLGADLSSPAIRFSSSIAERWMLSERLKYSRMSTTDLLETLQSGYEGGVAMVLLQFPTPFQIEGYGNQQLPHREGFMASKKVMSQIAKVLQAGGYLLIQSNCEDVAVQMHEMALEAGLSPVPAREPVTKVSESLNERTFRWLATNPVQRAIGRHWSCEPWIPTQSETEVACEVLQGTAVHRCLLKAPQNATGTAP